MKLTVHLPQKAIIIALVILISDQITKLLALHFFSDGPRAVLPFFNFVLVWNRGVSFGMFSGSAPYAPYVLSALALVVVAGLAYWMTKIDHNPLKIAICIVIAGAIGNVIDRLRFGAVVDFLDFHAFGWHYPAFNIADSAIVLGIAYIVVDSILWEPKRTIIKKEVK